MDEIKDNQSLRTQINRNSDQQRQALSSSFWWHSIDLGPAGVTPGVHQLGELQANFQGFGLPDDLRGKRVLDIGCWDGFYAFEAERRGAEVVAIDCWRPETFFIAKKALDSKVAFHEISIYEVSRERLGVFDFVLCLGVIYHLRHPLLALERVCEVTTDCAIIESHSIDHLLETSHPIMELYELTELGGQYDNWWGPNTSALHGLARAAGFARTDIIKTGGGRSSIRAYRKWLSIDSAGEALQIREVVNAVLLDQAFANRGRFALLAIFIEGLSGEENLKDILIEMGGYGVTPVYVIPPKELSAVDRINNLVPPGLGASSELRRIAASCTQLIVPMPPGLVQGKTGLRVRYQDKISNDFTLSVLELGRSTLSEGRVVEVKVND